MTEFEKAEKDIEWVNWWDDTDPIVAEAVSFYTHVLSRSVQLQFYVPTYRANQGEWFTRVAAGEYFKFGAYRTSVVHDQTEGRVGYGFFSPNMADDALSNLVPGANSFTYRRPDKNGVILPLHKVLLRRSKVGHKDEVEYEELKQVLFRHFSNTAMIKDEILTFRKSLELWATHANTVDKVKVSLNFTPFVEGDAERISAEYLKLHG